MTEETKLKLEMKNNKAGILTFYVNDEPTGIVTEVRGAKINDQWAYPIEFSIVTDKGYLLLRSEKDKITVVGEPKND
jgi:hypothetical protein